MLNLAGVPPPYPSPAKCQCNYSAGDNLFSAGVHSPTNRRRRANPHTGLAAPALHRWRGHTGPAQARPNSSAAHSTVQQQHSRPSLPRRGRASKAAADGHTAAKERASKARSQAGPCLLPTRIQTARDPIPPLAAPPSCRSRTRHAGQRGRDSMSLPDTDMRDPPWTQRWFDTASTPGPTSYEGERRREAVLGPCLDS